ncbi:MAG: flagellar motor protein MotB [Spirochaetales bacterium]|nr:flagellar motor protein MotB [Spirochaetales bacterium]
MAGPKKAKKCPPEGSPEWMTTYGDMVTLLLTFFVLMYTTATVDGYKMKLVLSAFSGLGMLNGGNTLQVGKLAEMGHTVASLPSMQKGRALDQARRHAISLFQPETNSKLVRITEDERGLIISFAADAFFDVGSADVDIEASRDTLRKASVLLKGLGDEQKFRIEGHTDSLPTDPDGEFYSNWELSSLRAINVLHYLSDFGVNEQQFQVSGLAETVPLVSNDTPEGRAYNRRVDIVILTEGHL